VTDQEAINVMTDGWSFVMQQGAMLALMPIEDWIEALDNANTLAPVLDPTLYLKSVYSDKPRLIREVLEGAMVFKRAILKVQKEVTDNPRLQA
jgi:hypothetical protein